MASPPEDPPDLEAALAQISALRAELEASRTALARLQRLCDHAPDTLVLHDAEGRLLAFNAAAARDHGYSREELGALRIGELVPRTTEVGAPDRPAWDTRPLEGAISLETTHRHRDGRELTFETIVAPVDPVAPAAPDGDARQFAVIGHDPSERKRADRERQRVERRFRAIFDAAPVGVISLDAHRAILAANAALARMCGVDDPATLVGRSFDALLVSEDADEAAGRLAALVMGGSDTERFECQLAGALATDGTGGLPRGVEVSALVDRNVAGAERELMVFVEDVSERRRTEDQRQRMFEQLDELVAMRTEELSGANDRLRAEINERRRTEVALQEAKLAAESANRAKSQFLASMSHELRTPLNAIIGYAEILMEDAEDEGREDEVVDLEKIRGAGRHLLGIINDILDLSKVEAGKVELFFEDVDLAKLVREVMTTIRPLANRGGNELDLQLRSHPEVLHTDVTRLRQILFNLLSNACKFTEEGQVTLSIDEVASEEGPGLRFVIADTGVGMNPGQLEKLFVPFTQADASTTRKFGGTGLGLSISDRFAKMLGGRIEVASTFGQGSTFTVWIPIEHPEQAESRAHRSSSTMKMAAVREARDEGLEHPRVLVVDDDPEARDLLARLLGREGYPVSQAASGTEALEMARTDPPGLITLDVLMPGMDGWAVLSRLKETPELASIPVIIVSLVRDRGMAYALGAADFLSKPVERDKLLASIHRFDEGEPPFTILVVDDEADARDLIARALQREDWAVRTATNGLDALDEMRAEKPDLVVLDLMMPGMDGFEVLEHVRSDPGLRDLPVVVVTAKDLADSERENLSRRVASVMQKGSYSREHLLECVAREADRVRRRGITP